MAVSKFQNYLSLLWLIIWKNCILRKRQWIVTSFEIILPTLCACLFWGIASESRSRNAPSPNDPSAGLNTRPSRTFEPIDQARTFTSVRSELHGFLDGESRIAQVLYSPLTSHDLLIEAFPQDDTEPKFQWRGFPTLEAMTKSLAEIPDDTKKPKVTVTAAFHFEGLESKKITYTIRIGGQSRTKRNILFRPIPDYAPEDSQMSIAGIQLQIDRVLLKRITGTEPNYAVSLHQFPVPEEIFFEGNFQSPLMPAIFPHLLIIGFIFLIPSNVRLIVSEKQTGIKEFMKINGVSESIIWFGWMINSLIISVVSITLIVILLSFGKVLDHTDLSLFWVLLLLYISWATSYCFLISALFDRPTLAFNVGNILWLTCHFALWFTFTDSEEAYSGMTTISILCYCLLPHVPMQIALKILIQFEKGGVGAQWSSLLTPADFPYIDSMNIFLAMVMLLVDTALYWSLAIYIQNILPSKYGVRKPWYYLFQISEWGFCKNKVQRSDVTLMRDEISQVEQGHSFEKVSPDAKVAIEVLKLRKEFARGRVAVENVSIKINEGEIFCLLGHNGAGKTTTLSILTGMLSPSSGTALVNGLDIRLEVSEIQKSIGFCPQHNLYFSNLTVSEHLEFFGRMKGLSKKEAKARIPVLLERLQIADKANNFGKALSGGQLRKLALGCALIGNAKVLFLDECSSGLDPEARRFVWNLLLEQKGQRTIVLTTHFMEEADVLGDRVAIMKDGNISCCGSPLFLKQYYGTGYSLSITMDPSGNPGSVLQLVQEHVDSAKQTFCSQMNNNDPMVLVITIPSLGETSSKLPAMFSQLLANKQELLIQDIGISMTTLDDVFIKVDSMNPSNTDAIKWEQDTGSVPQAIPLQPKIRGSLILSQFWGILMKKVSYSCKKLLTLVFMIGICVFLSITGFFITSEIQKNNVEKGGSDPIPISLSMYNTPKTLYSSVDQRLGYAYEQAIGSDFSSEKLNPGQLNDEWLLQRANKDKRSYGREYIIGAELDLKTPVVRYSPMALYSCPLAINTLTNAILRLHSPTTTDARINVILHPLPYEGPSHNHSVAPIIGMSLAMFMMAIFLPLGFTIFTAAFVILPIQENQCKVKQLQLMTGLSPGIYWLGSFLWDYTLFFFSSIAVIICCSLIDTEEWLTNNGGLGVLLLILLVYGVEAIGVSYLVSLRAKTVSGGYSFLIILHFVFGVFLFFLATGTEIMGKERRKVNPMLLVYFSVGRLFPSYSLTKSIFGFMMTSITNYYCSINRKEEMCMSSTGGLLLRPLLTWINNDPVLIGGVSNYVKTSSDEGSIDFLQSPGIGQEILAMILMAVFYFGVLIVYESCRIPCLPCTQNKKFVINTTDEDVQEERNRVDKMVGEGKTTEDALLVHDLSKNFNSFSAVSRLTFGVHRGECFGLLGVNGAGKTTAFRMLTGDESVSFGNACIDELCLLKSKKRFLERIGYCPQFDAFIGVLSGESMLQLFARLRGVHVSEAVAWLKKFGLSSSGKYRCDSYSGGMKRRLCTAIAMIGNPTLVLLDEPTSGVDPVSRRQFWKVVAAHRDAGNAVVLTSHSMEECEFLCGRLGIMVNGELQCFGGVQHLKSKFALGKSLVIKLKVEAASQEDAVTALTNAVLAAYKPCFRRDYHANTMQFQIDSLDLAWDKLFQIMEDMKLQFNNLIEEYSISQCTLEEVFLSFARKQYDNERREVGRRRKRCTLSCC